MVQKYFDKSEYLFFIDTCSLMNDRIEEAINILIPILKSNKIHVPYVCINELKKLEKTHIAASRAIEILKKKKELFVTVGDRDDGSFADVIFLKYFNELRIKHNIVFMTQDKKLKKDVLGLNDQKSVKGKRIEVFGIKDLVHKINNKTIRRFTIKKEITKIPDVIIKLDKEPKVNDELNSERNGKIKLVSKLKDGGEGTVFKTNSNFVAKIYKANKLTEQKLAKIDLIIRSGIKIEGVCFPCDKLYDEKDNFVGYLMPMAKGKTLEWSVFRERKGIERYFPQWNKKNLVEMAISIFQKIKKIHDYGIIIGDINGSNIMVESPKEVYFVDTDSYQIEEFPCPVGTPKFTAPEIQGCNYKSTLRTMGNENFAIATLLFKILMYGQDPYAQKDGASIEHNIRTGDFSYPYRDNKNGKLPVGDWRFFWSHIYFPIKEKLYCTFKKGECLFLEDKRPSSQEWLGLLKRYEKELDSPNAKSDEMSLELFPSRYKKYHKFEYVSCKVCGEVCQKDRVKEGLCKKCLATRREEQERKKREEQERKKSVYATKICSHCNHSFDITVGEKEFFETKGLNLPKKCEKCRGNDRTFPTSKSNVQNKISSNLKKKNLENKKSSSIFEELKKFFKF